MTESKDDHEITEYGTSDDSSKLHFSANGGDVLLRTRMGDLNFNMMEYSFYQMLFRIADSNTNSGRLTSTNSHLSSLLTRTRLTVSQIEKILSFVNSGKHRVEDRASLNGISLNQWLILCKLIAYTQSKSSLDDIVPIMSQQESNEFLPDSDALEYVHIYSDSLPVADFSFGRDNVYPLPLIDEYHCEIKGYKVYGEGFRHQHFKFTILTETRTTSSRADSIIKSSNSCVETVRRYSDFELLANILQRFYPGVILPPLPPKLWTFHATTEAMGVQRSRELQLFLSNLTHHPILRHTYEVKAFLEASTSGFRSFRELFPSIQGSLIVGATSTTMMISAPVTDGSSNGYVTSANSILTSATNTALNLVNQTSALSFMTSWMGAARSVISTTTASLTSSLSSKDLDTQFEQDLKDFVKYFELINLVSHRLDVSLTLEGRSLWELSHMGQNLKQLAEYSREPNGLDSDLITVSNFLERLVPFLETRVSLNRASVLGSLQYLGRFLESLKNCLRARDEATRDLETKHQKEMKAMKVLDQVTISARVSQASKDGLEKWKHEVREASAASEGARLKDNQLNKTVRQEVSHLQVLARETVKVWTPCIAFVTC